MRLCPDEWIDQLLPSGWDRAELDRYRDPVERIQIELAGRALRLGLDVVLEFGSWGRSEREALRALARQIGAGFELCYLDVPLEELLVRRKGRVASSTPGTFDISEAELRRLWLLIERPTDDELADVWPAGSA